MAEQDSAPGGDLDQIARIVSSYVRHHQLGPEQLVELIVTVHRALASVGQTTPPMPEPRRPAVPIRRFGATRSRRLPRVRVSRADAPPASVDRP